jgi:hypothetical protein
MYILLIENTTGMHRLKISSAPLVTVVQLWLLHYISWLCTAFLEHYAT